MAPELFRRGVDSFDEVAKVLRNFLSGPLRKIYFRLCLRTRPWLFGAEGITFDCFFFWSFALVQGSGVFLAEGGMEASYLKMTFHESHTVGHCRRMGPQNLLFRCKLGNSGYMKTEDDTNCNFGWPS